MSDGQRRGGLVPAGEILKPLQQELALTPAQEKLLETSIKIRQNPATINDAVFQHGVLCQVGMPRKKTTALSFERTYGADSILMTAGSLWQRGQWVKQPLPYGPKPRLVLIYAITEALKNSTCTSIVTLHSPAMLHGGPK